MKISELLEQILCEGYCQGEEKLKKRQLFYPITDKENSGKPVLLGGVTVWLDPHAVCRQNERHVPDDIIIHAVRRAYELEATKLKELPDITDTKLSDARLHLAISLKSWPAQVVVQKVNDDQIKGGFYYNVKSIYRGDKIFANVGSRKTVGTLPLDLHPQEAKHKLEDMADGRSITYSDAAWFRIKARPSVKDRFTAIKINPLVVSTMLKKVSKQDLSQIDTQAFLISKKVCRKDTIFDPELLKSSNDIVYLTLKVNKQRPSKKELSGDYTYEIAEAGYNLRAENPELPVLDVSDGFLRCG